MSADNTQALLIAQMKRVLEILESGKEITPYSSQKAELSNKLHEIRRDSIRYMEELNPWKN